METNYLEELSSVLTDEFEIESDAIIESARLYEDLGLDSIDAVDLVVRLREITGKRVPPEQFKTVRTVGDVISVLQRL